LCDLEDQLDEAEALKYKRDIGKVEGEDTINSFVAPAIETRKWQLRFILVIYHFVRFVYKGFYYYVFPYLIVPLSYIVWEMQEFALEVHTE
jgi:hypothetical protein